MKYSWNSCREGWIIQTMRAMILEAPRKPLTLVELPIPQPGSRQVLLKVHTCGVCHTDLHILDGELKNPKIPLILGHQIVGTVIRTGKEANRYLPGDRVGVPWLGETDGTCRFCLESRENLCDHPRFTGYDINGGFAEYAVADERFCFSLPAGFTNVTAAPLLCAGMIGYRAYRMAGDYVSTLGIYGFGAAAHIIAQVARFEGKKVFAFTRPGDSAAQELALRRGANWAGDSTHEAPEKLDAALIFAPVGPLVLTALKTMNKGGVIICGGIHMSDIPSFPYNLLWGERIIRSVANLTRRDGEEFLALASMIPVETDITVFPLVKAWDALEQLRNGQFTGVAVISISEK
jgi:alcohol dehydrogenase, propanol-preferring